MFPKLLITSLNFDTRIDPFCNYGIVFVGKKTLTLLVTASKLNIFSKPPFYAQLPVVGCTTNEYLQKMLPSWEWRFFAKDRNDFVIESISTHPSNNNEMDLLFRCHFYRRLNRTNKTVEGYFGLIYSFKIQAHQT